MFTLVPVTAPGKREKQAGSDCNLMALSNLTGLPRESLGPRLGTGDPVERCSWFEAARQRLVALGYYIEWFNAECETCMEYWRESPTGVMVIDFGEEFEPHNYHAIVVKEDQPWFDSATRETELPWEVSYYIRAYRLAPS